MDAIRWYYCSVDRMVHNEHTNCNQRHAWTFLGMLHSRRDATRTALSQSHDIFG
jgi:hypothetical protein